MNFFLILPYLSVIIEHPLSIYNIMILSNPLRTGKNHIIYPNFSNNSFNGGSGDRFLIRFLKKTAM